MSGVNCNSMQLERTLIVCTVLTGTLEIAMLENMWPNTWNAPMGSVFRTMAMLGVRSRENRTRGLMKIRQ